MQDSEETKDQKKVRYRVQVVSDGDSGMNRHFSTGLGVVVAFLAAVALLVMAALAYCFILAGELNRSNDNAARFQMRVEELAGQNEELLAQMNDIVKENEELQEKVEILSDTINEKVQQEKEREAEIAKSYIPTGFPLRGTASYKESETKLAGNPVAVFNASVGTSVVATANGTVSSVAEDVQAGYIVTVDHGNGYFSIYRNGAAPKVKEGDKVTNMTELFRIEYGKEELGYQIMENDKYIEPLSLMETYG